VYRLLCAGTAEERIMDFSERKMLLDHVLLASQAGGAGGVDAWDEEGDLERMSISELWDILRHGSEEVRVAVRDAGPSEAPRDAGLDGRGRCARH
jgi:hypothetical protein